MTAVPLWRRSAVEHRASVRTGECSVGEIAAACLERVAQLEPSVQAWSWCDPQQVMRAARDIDDSLLPLAGVLIGVKDIIDTADMPTAYGAEMYRGHLPAQDAALVRRLRAAGALIVGKTVTTEFAYAAPGPTCNPHHLAHTPGGSSSGSAAAVAAGMVPLAISSQTGGSTIRPAAYCGVLGFKPSHGSIDSTGMKPLAPASDTVGIHARSIDDIALILPLLSAFPVVSSSTLSQSLRIGWFPGPHDAEASAEGRAALQSARRLLLEAGFDIGPITLPEDEMAALAEINRTIMAFEAASSLRTEYEQSRMRLTVPTRELIERGHSITVSAYKHALVRAEHGREMLAQAMRGVDLLMTYSAPGAAPLATAGTGSSVFNRAWSTLGVPCLSLPCGRGRDSALPLAVQFIAPMGMDYRLLDIGRVIEGVLCRASDTSIAGLAGG